MRIRGAIGLGIALVVLKLLLGNAFEAFESAATSFFGTVDTHITRSQSLPQQSYATPLFSIPQIRVERSIPHTFIDVTASQQ